MDLRPRAPREENETADYAAQPSGFGTAWR